MTGVEKHYIIL